MPSSPPLLDVKLLDHPVTTLPFDERPGAAGGECTFLGRTRSEVHPDHGALRQLHYEAYEPMAERSLRTLAKTAATEHGCVAIRIHHALGPVPLGAASVLVQTLAPHRAEAFAACRFLIDALKSETPIWKREEWSDGTTWSSGMPVTRGVPDS
ncbi:MAG: molybdenum cofactor biosynthesis protein MoaE [Phycisphaerales bacterium]|nr:molybdenum cofactor biosynthesis protein MoaE [Phycisphaerae bacterium]NNF42008.1 molybdenum cofactor biosynthesis protein MoaE [Phycisphaerales bacterium]NNM24828.1 molybdenum cofactor biosynthesis protein MoaE [Phycisphaerales bacterium]